MASPARYRSALGTRLLRVKTPAGYLLSRHLPGRAEYDLDPTDDAGYLIAATRKFPGLNDTNVELGPCPVETSRPFNFRPHRPDAGVISGWLGAHWKSTTPQSGR